MIIKISILKGEEKKEIKLNDGGGRRYCSMNKSDSFYNVAKKIKESYEKIISLYSKDRYLLNFLDFKREFINQDFDKLDDYLKKNGLKPNQGILFYLQIVEKPKVFLTNTSYENSFSQITQNSSSQVQITNSFLLQNKQQIIKPLVQATKSDMSTESSSSLASKVPITPAATKSIKTLKSSFIYIPKIQTNNQAISESDSDSSESSTSSAKVNKLTTKRTNKEINTMKNEISEKKFKSINQTTITTKKEPDEDIEFVSSTTKSTEYINRSQTENRGYTPYNVIK